MQIPLYVSAGVLNLENVLCVPKITKNLKSVSKLTQDNDIYLEFCSDCYFVKDIHTGKVMLKGVLKDGLYRIIDGTTDSASTTLNQCAKSANKPMVCSVFSAPIAANTVISKAILHQRLGHPSLKTLDTIITRCNLPVKINDSFHFCESCKFGKAHAVPFSRSLSHATAPFDLVHNDLWGPVPIVWFFCPKTRRL